MKTKNIYEINKLDSLAIVEILENWKYYDKNTIIISYLELKRRGFSISENLQKNEIQSFCDNNNVENIEKLVLLFLKENHYYSIEDFFKELNKNLGPLNLENTGLEPLNLENSVIDPSNIILAGKAIKDIVKIALLMIIVALFSFLFILVITEGFSNSSLKIVKKIENTNIFLGLLFLVCNVIILFLLQSAGSNLEKSVKKRP